MRRGDTIRALVGLVVLAVFGGAAVIVATGSTAASESPSPATSTGASVTGAAALLFQQNCASCHGVHGEGGPNGPSLVGAGAAAADFFLTTGRMPLGAPGQPAVRQDPHFDAAQIAALVGVVAGFGPGPAIPVVRQGGDIARGRDLFVANCAACHGATGAGDAVGGGYAAASLRQADAVQVAEAMLIGPGAMPRFVLSQDDRDAIVAYVLSLRHVDNPGGLAIGGIGPVAEGFVAIFLGLGAVLVIVRLVGGKAPEPGPSDEARGSRDEARTAGPGGPGESDMPTAAGRPPEAGT